VIDERAKAELQAHLARLSEEGKTLYAGALPAACTHGSFLPPHLLELASMRSLQREAFGPILHLIRWSPDRLHEVTRAITASGYGLTGGVHSRREGFARQLAEQLPIGNFYINRNLIGAIPGVQPFGGDGLSGTGPKAGGPHYVRRFTTERVITTDTTAAGGNASLLMLED
jgi:RHH-type transcriptional regulator, proline utilization regulon repressor / proline dehydrogenase / delta 1-pyrroline-5-carboxylate dehydrogenase